MSRVFSTFPFSLFDLFCYALSLSLSLLLNSVDRGHNRWKNEIAKGGFVRHMRDIVGEMLRLAVNKLQVQLSTTVL
ncbi:Uncharacterized protein TCM_004086 [Theobroma cacao]|uniref:RST domain-containing protein n=1 Tax=Theobroma cacao TaxID=3641 RepID=A0A061DNT7_THECC|nr:Uncharacterized protein TCM_004086 [Theobroma cacao]